MFYLFEDIKNKSLNLSDKLFSTLFLLLPIAIISGPFLSDLILSLIGVYFISVTIKNNLWKYYKNYFVYIFIYFYLYLILNSILSDDPLFSLKSSLFYFRYLFFVLGASYLIKINNKIINQFLVVLVALSIFIFFDSILQFLYGYNIFGWKLISGRVSSFFGDDLVMGRYFIHFMPIILALILIQNQQKHKILIISSIMLAIIFVITILSGGRTSLFNLFLASFLIICFTTQFRKYALYLLFILFAILSILFLSSSALQERYKENTLDQIITKDGVYLLSKEHQAIFVTSFRMFLDKPLLGHGPNLFRKTCSNPKYNVPLYGCSTHPHNTYLQLLAEIGIVGILPLVLGFLLIIVLYMRQLVLLLFNNNKKILTDYQLCLLTSITVTLWPLTTSLNFFNNWINILYYLPFCFIMIRLDNNNKFKNSL